MSVDATMAVLYAQTGLATSMVNAAAVAPQAAAAMSRMLAAEMARQEQQQVTKSDSGEKAALSSDAEGKGSAAWFGNRRRARPQPPAGDEQPKAAASPFVGNFLNVKV